MPLLRQQSKMTFYYTYTGFGDVVLDLIGIATWVALNPSLHIFFVFNNNRKPANRVYDMSLFKYEDKRMNLMESHMGGLKSNSGVKTIKGAPGCSIHPQKISETTDTPYERTRDDFLKNAYRLRPCTLITNALPNLEGCIGIHLRKSDKIGEKDPHHGTTLEEFDSIVFMMKEYIKDEISGGNKRYFVCSEDRAWRRQFVEWLEEVGGEVVSPSETNDALSTKRGWESILDFFCLTKCQKIIQGIGYSTFSMAASLVGGGIPLVNLHMKAVEKPEYFLNWWAPLLNLQMVDEEDCTACRDMRMGASKGVPALRTE
jgi:hypothetical protein